MSDYPRVAGVLSQQGTDLSAWINANADAYGGTPRGLVALLIAESGLNEQAARYGVWPDVSFSLGQQTVKYAVTYGVGDGTNTPENIERVRQRLTSDPQLAIQIAARQFGHYYQTYGSYEEAAAKYNGGPGASWATIPAGNRANYARAWAESARYVAPEEVPMGEYLYPFSPTAKYSPTHWDSNGDGKPDLAVDVFDWEGAPIVACTAGRVVIRDYRNGGHTAMLYGDDGYVYYHAHLVQGSGHGGRVEVGQLLGQVGRTGNAVTTPPHCHWAVATQQQGIDDYGQGQFPPWEWLDTWRAQAPPAEEEDMARIAELETILGEMQRIAREELIINLEDALAVKRLPASAREKIAAGALPAAQTIARLGVPAGEEG